MNHLRSQWRQAAQVKVTPGRGPLDYDRYNITHRVSLVEGAGHSPEIARSREKHEEFRKKWKQNHPGKRFPTYLKWAPPVGYAYFTDENTEPGTIGFVDVEAYNETVFIGYLAVRPDYRNKGMARKLIQAVYDQWPKASVNWGKLMQEEMGHLYDWYREHEPARTQGGKRNY